MSDGIYVRMVTYMPVDFRYFGIAILIPRTTVGGQFGRFVGRSGSEVECDRRLNILRKTHFEILVETKVVVEIPVLMKRRFQ